MTQATHHVFHQGAFGAVLHQQQGGARAQARHLALGRLVEREHGFEAVWDHRLTAAVNVSRNAEDNFIAETGDDDEIDDDGAFRTLYAKLDPDGDR